MSYEIVRKTVWYLQFFMFDFIVIRCFNILPTRCVKLNYKLRRKRRISILSNSISKWYGICSPMYPHNIFHNKIYIILNCLQNEITYQTLCYNIY